MPNFFWLFDVQPRSRTRHGNKNPYQEETGGEGQSTGEAPETSEAGKARETSEQTKARCNCGPRKAHQHGRLSPSGQTERIG